MSRYKSFLCSFCSVVALCLLVTGCCHTKPVAGPIDTTYSSHSSDSTNTTINNTIIHVIDTVLVFIPAESHSTIGEQNSHLETSVATSDAFVDSLGRLHHSLENKDTALSATSNVFVPVSDTNHYESHNKIDSVFIPQPYPVEKLVEKPLKWYQELFIRIGVISTIILLVYLAVTIYRKVHPS